MNFKIPSRKVLKEAAYGRADLIRRGYQELFKLNNFMKFQGLSQGAREVRVGDVIVRVSNCFGRSRIDVFRPTYEEEEVILEGGCFCECNISEGIVINIKEYNDEKIPPLEIKYDVYVCKGENFSVYVDAQAQDKFLFFENDKVLVTGFDLNGESGNEQELFEEIDGCMLPPKIRIISLSCIESSI